MPTLTYDLCNLGVERVREAHVSYHAAFEEGERSDALRSINDLVWDYKISWLDVFLQASYCAKSYDCSHTNTA